MMKAHQMNAIAEIVKRYPSVVAAYVFGSRVGGEPNAMSDYDIAVYLDEDQSGTNLTDTRLELIADLSKRNSIVIQKFDSKGLAF